MTQTTITTSYQSRPNSNVGKVVAKANGRQRSVTWDQSKSSDYNHGAAAGALVLALIGSTDPAKVKEVTEAMIARAEADWQHEVLDNGKHRFGVTL